MLRVRNSACSGSVGNVSSGSRVVAGSRCAGDSSAVFRDPRAFSGGDNNSMDVLLAKRRFCEHDAVSTVSESQRGAEIGASPEWRRGAFPCAEVPPVRFPRAFGVVDVPAGASPALSVGPGQGLSLAVDSGGSSRGAAHPVSDGDSGGVCPDRRSGPSVRLNADATASESTGIIGSLVCDMSESSLPNSDDSSMGVACVDLAPAAVASLLLSAHLLVHVLFVLLVLCTRVALCHPCMLHMHIIRGRTRLAYRVPGRGRGAKRVLPVQPKICVLSQRRRLV